MSSSLTFHTPCSVDVSLCHSAVLCVCCRHPLGSAGSPNCDAITSSFSFSLQKQQRDSRIDGPACKSAPPISLLILHSKGLDARADAVICVVAEYGVCENLRKLEITGVSCRDVYAKRK